MDFRQLIREERRRAAETKSSNREMTVPKKATEKTVTSSSWQNSTLRVWTTRPNRIEIEKFRKGPIPGIYYLPNWINEEEEKAILDQVYAISDQSDVWVNLKHRRLQMWGGEVKTPFSPTPLPPWLMQISHTLVDVGIFSEDKRPNHILINVGGMKRNQKRINTGWLEYGVGDFILPHEDGPAYFPLVAIISTGTECRVTFERHRAATDPTTQSDKLPESFDFSLARRSLLLFTGESYTRYLHSIDNIETGTRISLTIRHVNEAKEGKQ
ncbi:hypothetical protein PsorP6_001544 [Peronosclerospora sorghi]|uniref:Uncharacterized protein n=1 Tax=Peronosclerospora sorghi TaxID=230839 RepID=A0ACC0WQG1_9STRA|nr:hypothetical protein PsorP6_001544 [Peronosclerospora sorghi]